jgi:hypothetical protein
MSANPNQQPAADGSHPSGSGESGEDDSAQHAPIQPAPIQPAPEPAARPTCLTAAEIAELNRLDYDPDYYEAWQEDPETGAPDWWDALPPAEQARQLNEPFDYPAEVPESIGAGFTHRFGGNGAGFAAGGELDVMLPGSGLAASVGRVRRDGVGYLSDDALIGYTVAAGELESWAAGLKTEAVGELDRRRAGPDGREGEFVAAEVAKALTLTPRSAQILLEQSRGLERFPAVAALLRAGIIDPRHASLITSQLELLPDKLARQVLDRVLPRAGQLTTGELRAALQRAIIAVDPQAAIRRREKAQKDARVEVWTEDSGTAALAGRDLNPAEVIAVDQQLTADAKWLKANGVEGTEQQLRARALTARGAGQPLTSLLPPASSGTSPSTAGNAGADGTPGPATGAGQASRGGRQASAGDSQASSGGSQPATGAGQPGSVGGSVNLTAPVSSWLGVSDNPGDAASYGPIDAGTCRDLIQRLAAAGPATQWCLTLVDDQGRAVGHGCARTGPPGTGPPGSLSDKIAWLASIKITTIAAGTCDHQHESPGYRPSDSLRHLIKIRSPRCGEPGCRTPARRCDDDHVVPYHLGGKTCECKCDARSHMLRVNSRSGGLACRPAA